MRTGKLTKRKSARWGLLTLIVMVSLLSTGCSGSKKASGTPAVAETQASPDPAIQLSDDCALLHIYRVGRMAGSAIGYDVNLDGDKVYRATNKSKTTIRITEEGRKTLSAKTESQTELPLEIELGREYYIRCGMKMGVMVGRPSLEIVDAATGKAEFNNIPFK